MPDPDYDYQGLLASTWDLWRGDTSGWPDRAFYLDLIRSYGEPALDIGCGTGRIMVDFLAAGIDIEGVDNSPEMLEICREKAAKFGLVPSLHEQNLLSLDLPRMYKTILIPSSTLQLITDHDEAREALTRCYACLESGGALAAPFSFDWQEGEPLESDWELLFEKVRPEDGAIVRSRLRERNEPDKQLWHAEQTFEVEIDGKIVVTEFQRRSPEGRWYRQEQATALFCDAGFADVQLFSGFTHKAAGPRDRLFTVVGVKL